MNTKIFSLFIGRYQSLHEGHIKLIRKVLKEGKNVCVALRDTETSEDNPYTIAERRTMFAKEFTNEILNSRLIVMDIPDIEEICYGRKVGYGIRRIRLDKQTEEISGTKIRNSNKRVIWLTGNVKAGKTSIAYLLKERLNGVVLDGDEMRQSISVGAGFSKEDREEHNLRVARLAKVLSEQGQNVIVSVIAPFQSTRDKIAEICNPYWIYLESDVKDEYKPYEVPENPDIIIDRKQENIEDSLEKIVKEIGGIK